MLTISDYRKHHDQLFIQHPTYTQLQLSLLKPLHLTPPQLLIPNPILLHQLLRLLLLLLNPPNTLLRPRPILPPPHLIQMHLIRPIQQS